MAIFSIGKVKISGLAACVPAGVECNAGSPLMSPKERALFIKTVGIEKRRKLPPHQTASDLCHKAAQRLLSDLQWDKSEVGVLVFVSQTPDYLTPATAVCLQHRLGLPQSCLAFDVNLGCSAYPYGLSVLAAMLSAGGMRKGLLLVGDSATRMVSPLDKSTAPLFSDAGSATALQFDEGAPPMHFNLQSDGAGYQSIIIPDGGSRNPFGEQSLEMGEQGKGVRRNRTHMAMNGLDIFNFALREVAPNITDLLQHIGQDAGHFDYFVFHQANRLLNESVRKKLKIPAEKVPYSLKDYGNTSAATIPVTLVARLREQLVQQRLELLLSGFGVGLSWASAAVCTGGICCPPMLVLDGKP